MRSQVTVAVVMCTYNGAKHLNAQLDSIAIQQWPLELYVFDDASTDNTVRLIESYAQQMKLKLHQNTDNLGYVANFEAAITKAIEDGHQYIALSDQDDIWHSSRLETGMQRLLETENAQAHQSPVIVHSDLTMIDADDKLVHPSFFSYRGYSIGPRRSVATVLGQNGVMGNTILINSALAKLALPFPAHLHVHDYWLAVIAELFGHRVLLDQAMVNYRIHQNNASNSNDSIKFGLTRLFNGKSLKGFIRRDYRLPFKEDDRLGAIGSLLNDVDRFPAISPDNLKLLTTFQQYLVFSGSRISMLVAMLKGGFFKKGLAHRMRIAYSLLTTKRYDR